MANLLTNYDFEIGDPPTGWAGVNATPTREGSPHSGSYCVGMTVPSDSPFKRVRQSIASPGSYSGQTLTLSVWLKKPAGGTNLRISIEDNVDRTEASYPGGTDWVLVTVTRTITDVCTVLYANVLWVDPFNAVTAYADDAELTLTTEAFVTTQAVSAIAPTTATGNGNVGAIMTATQHGHVWTTVNSPARPNLTDDAARKTSLGVPAVTGAYTSSLTGLTQNTIYYVRAYITDSYGTHYGSTVAFTTTGLTAPTITTQACTSVTNSNAVGNGNVVSAGGYTIERHGIVWCLQSAHPNPTISDVYAETVSGATGSFTEAITPLLANTAYWARAYVKTTTGLYFYGVQVALTTSAGLPILTTNLVTTISDIQATGNLTLTNNGGSTITQYGVVYDTVSHADPGNVLPSASAYPNYTEEGAAAGTFPQSQTSLISSLVSNTTYYLRAYATNSTGTKYGAEVSFKTKITGAPSVTTDDIFAMTYTTATVRGTLLDVGASAVTVSGMVWDTSPNPTTALGTKTTDGPTALGQFSSIATSLTSGTTYYVRAYATNTQGTSYGDNIQFVVGTPTGGTYFTPANAYTRVSGIVRTFWAGSVYQTQLLLGGTTTTYVSPISKKEIPSALSPVELPSGSGYQVEDYAKWLVNNFDLSQPVNTDNVTARLAFKDVPTYTDWLKRRVAGKW